MRCVRKILEKFGLAYTVSYKQGLYRVVVRQEQFYHFILCEATHRFFRKAVVSAIQGALVQLPTKLSEFKRHLEGEGASLHVRDYTQEGDYGEPADVE